MTAGVARLAALAMGLAALAGPAPPAGAAEPAGWLFRVAVRADVGTDDTVLVGYVHDENDAPVAGVAFEVVRDDLPAEPFVSTTDERGATAPYTFEPVECEMGEPTSASATVTFRDAEGAVLRTRRVTLDPFCFDEHQFVPSFRWGSHGRHDRLRIVTPDPGVYGGGRVVLRRIDRREGTTAGLRRADIPENGIAELRVRDRNGVRRTSYAVTVRPAPRTGAVAWADMKRVR